MDRREHALSSLPLAGASATEKAASTRARRRALRVAAFVSLEFSYPSAHDDPGFRGGKISARVARRDLLCRHGEGVIAVVADNLGRCEMNLFGK